MKTVKPQILGVLSRTFESGDACYFTVSALAFFSFDPTSPLLPEVELWKLAAAELPRGMIDAGMPKPRGEVLVTGSAFPLGGARPACAPRVAIGTVDKTLYVAGDRGWKDGVASDPAPFAEMPITYDRAFGGPGHAMNPTGKGAAPGGEIHPLPNVEDPARLVRSPGDRPPPAGFGPYELTWPQRFSKAGTYDEAWQRERYPGLPADMDWTVWNTAPEDQWLAGYFRGDEGFTLEHMHPSTARIEGRLPGVRARAFITQKSAGGEAFREIGTHLDTVWLFPRAERGIVIFRGTIEIAEDDAADVVHLVLGFEALGAPKPVEHYEGVLARRLDRKRGHVAALQDGDLLPAGKALASNDAEKAAYVTEGLIQKRGRRRIEREREEARQRLIAAGLDPGALVLPPLPPEEPAQGADDPEAVERAFDEAERVKEEAEAKKAEAEKHFRETCAARGLDPDKALREAREGAAGPPKLSADAELDRMRDVSRRAKAEGQAAPVIDAALADPSFEDRLRAVERQGREAYLKLAHHMPPARRLAGEQAAALRAEVAEGCRAGRSFAGRDLTGADLSGLDLRGADFRLAFLERAGFVGADLRGADFTDAVLARADLTRAKLSGAFLPGANLGEAKLEEAEADGADLAGAVLVRADLTRANFRGARMARVDLSEAVFTGADLTRAEAPEASFVKTDLSGATLAGADLRKGNFIEPTVAGVDFTGCKLVAAVFVGAKGDGAVFRDADLANLRVVQGSSFERADLHGARLPGAYLRGTKLAGSDFGGAILDGADLGECDLRGATFLRAVARRARFVRADLTGAIMRSVNLMEGSLAKAILLGTDLRRSNLFRVDMAKARTDEATNLEGANVKRARTSPLRR